MLLLMLAGLVTGCSVVNTTAGGGVGIDRKQYMASGVSEAALQQEANAQYAQMMSQAGAKKALNTDAAQTRRVRAIAQRLIRHVGVFRPDAQSWRWEINVLQSNEINAWCMPGGKMAIYTGLIQKIKPTDAELAAIIGHEMAHALREHARERVSQQMTANLGLAVLSAVTGSGAATDLGQQFSEVMFTLPGSRTHETEADRIGVELAARAGYDPHAAVSLWKKMAQQNGGAQPEFLSSHPSSATRISDLEQAAAKIESLYRAAAKP